VTSSPTTRPFVLLGDPVTHSLSPVMQNAAFDAAGIDAVYFAIRCSAELVPTLMAAVARAGGGGNITIPHKGVAAGAVERPTAAVRATGACNTFWFEDGQLAGDNTDVTGVTAVMTGLVGSLSGARGLVIGAGGAARATVFALLDAGASAVVLGRSRDRLALLQSTFSWAEARLTVTGKVESIRSESFQVVVNATPLGMRPGDALPLDLDDVITNAVVDLVYGPSATPWIRAAVDRGIPAADGREMLVAQGAAAFERWCGSPAPVPAMRKATGLG